MNLLIVEDEPELLKSITTYFYQNKFACDTALDFSSASNKMLENEYACIILDITLPGGSGLELLRWLKKSGKAEGVLIISAKNSLDDKIEGLELGADDYLTKPFHFAELSARINSIYRRNNFSGLNEINFNEIKVNLSDKQAYVNNNLLNLTRKEFDLLLFFVTNSNRIITKESIVEHLWGDEVILTDSFDFVYTHVKNLRKKITAAGSKNYIKCIYCFGYKFLDS